MNWAKLSVGFADSVPAPLASNRHLRRLLYITIGIAIALLLQARNASATPAVSISKVPMYLMLIGVELVLARFVTIGAKARGYRLLDIVGQPWRNLIDAISDFAVAAATVLLLRFSSPVLFYFLGRWGSNTGFLLPKTLPESATWIAVSLAAGFCEELVYRGYLQRQLWSRTRNLPLALVLQAAIFACGHLYQGWKPALVTAIYGLVFGLVAAWRRSIIPGAIAHAAIDIMGGFKL
ncbi:MAG TPA: type II CAAX endopeptidase family protein [Chthoniobacterales bacterium]|nr:type II CAAX endopeptidase family protein [Chthoniobacterales bacterium]